MFIGLHLPWRLAAPGRVVMRRVQGVDLIVPWSHALPDYARKRPTYGQNIVCLADELHRREGRPTQPMAVLDVGANVGDTAAQILARTEARVLCVEADPYWAEFLHRNLDHDPRATIVEALLVAGDLSGQDVRAVRANGTTRFAEHASAPTAAAAAAAAPSITAAELRRAHPGFDGLRLVKSDTEGFDTKIVPAVVEAWRDRSPVVFFAPPGVPLLGRGGLPPRRHGGVPGLRRARPRAVLGPRRMAARTTAALRALRAAARRSALTTPASRGTLAGPAGGS